MRKILTIVLAILLFDGLTKALVNFYLPSSYYVANSLYGGIPVFKDFFGINFYIQHVTNKGAAWGVGGNFQSLLQLIRIGVVLVLGFYLFLSKKAKESKISLSMIFAGGLGNILDYFIYGHVIDMFHFIFWGYSYPVFNIADASIFLGMVILLGSSFFKSRKHAAPQN